MLRAGLVDSMSCIVVVAVFDHALCGSCRYYYVMYCCNNVIVFTAHQGRKELQVFMVTTILITSAAGKILCNNCILH